VGFKLLAAAVLCEAISIGASYLHFEICHQGIPLQIPVLALPIAGTLCAIASFFFPPTTLWPAVTKVVVAAANVVQLAAGAMTVAGPGLVSC
jgi:hypothetical protein